MAGEILDFAACYTDAVRDAFHSRIKF